MTVTVTAACKGETSQPATSSKTSRKSTAVSAAETSASATAGPTARRGPSAGTEPSAACRGGARAAPPGGGRRHRRLGEEDPAPGERLGQRAAQRRADRGGQHGRAEPQPAPALTCRAAGLQQREGRDQRRRAAERLHAASDEQQPERVAGTGATEATAKSTRPTAAVRGAP